MMHANQVSGKDIKTITLGISIFFGSLLLLTFIYLTRNILALIFIAYLISLAMAGPVNFLQNKTHWKRGTCTGISYIIVIALISFGFYLIIPSLFQQMADLIKKFNLNQVTEQLDHAGLSVDNFDNVVKELTNLSKSFFTSVANFFISSLQIFTMLILSFHLVISQGDIKKHLKTFTKNESLANALEEFSELLKKNLGGWLRGEFFLMLTIGVISFIAFSLIGIPFALPLAVLAGLLEIIPSLGPTLAAIPAIGVAFSISPAHALITLIVCVIIQQVENIFLVPRIMKTAAGVNPMVSIIAILIGFQLLGVVGALLAIPTYILFRSAYVFFIRDQRHLHFS